MLVKRRGFLVWYGDKWRRREAGRIKGKKHF